MALFVLEVFVMTDEAIASTEEQVDEQQGGDTENDAGAGEDTSLDISKIPVDKLLEHPEVQRQLQSMKDKEAARIERGFRERQAREAAAAEARSRQAELDALVDNEDYDTLGRQKAEALKAQRSLSSAAREVSAVLEDLVRARPEFRDLGEETIASTFDAVKERNGTILDWMYDLSSLKAQRDLDKQVKTIRSEMAEEMEAKLAEYGLTKRNEDEETGNAPSPAVSRGKRSASAPTDEDALLLAAGRGEDVDLAKVREILKTRGVKL